MGERLKKLREKAGMTQKEVAEKIGVGQSSVSMWEIGKSTPQTKLLIKIAELYGCSVYEILI